jgi:hypothetical protein
MLCRSENDRYVEVVADDVEVVADDVGVGAGPLDADAGVAASGSRLSATAAVNRFAITLKRSAMANQPQPQPSRGQLCLLTTVIDRSWHWATGTAPGKRNAHILFPVGHERCWASGRALFASAQPQGFASNLLA